MRPAATKQKATFRWTLGLGGLPRPARNYLVVVAAIGLMVLAANVMLFFLDDHDLSEELGLIAFLCVLVALGPSIPIRRGSQFIPYHFWEYPVVIGLALAPPYVVVPAVVMARLAALLRQGIRDKTNDQSKVLMNFGFIVISFTIFCYVGALDPPYTFVLGAMASSLTFDVLLYGFDSARDDANAWKIVQADWAQRLVLPILLSAAAAAMVTLFGSEQYLLLASPALLLIVFWVGRFLADIMDDRTAWRSMQAISAAFIGEMNENEAIRVALEKSRDLFAASRVEIFIEPLPNEPPGRWRLDGGESDRISFDPITVGDLEGARSAPDDLRRRRIPLQHGSSEIGFLVVYWDHYGSSRGLAARGELDDTLGHAIASSLITTRHNTQISTQAADKAREAQTDALTGLGNRSMLLERGPGLLLEADEIGLPCALILFDLDRFKRINDTLGHSSGDVLLQEVGRRIQSTVRVGDLAIRLGGDEFAVLAVEMAHPRDAVMLAGKLKAALAPVIEVDGLDLSVEASFGIAIHGSDGDSVKQLLKMADIAMYRAKSLGRNEIVEYTPGIDFNTTDSLMLANDLRQAIFTGDQLVLHYQPQVDLKTGAVVGMEALIRWNHPVRGMLSPDKFVPLAENSGLIQQFTAYIIDLALADRSAVRSVLPDATVSVNLSARNLLDRGLAADVSAALTKHAVSPAELVLEVTETISPGDNDAAENALAALFEVGCQLSVDDFGTGFATLETVREGLPMNEIKIDRRFVSHIDSPGRGSAIVSACVQIGHAAGCRVVAEGVESRQTLDILAGLGCDVAQGYYLMRPSPLAEVMEWVKERQADVVGVPGPRAGNPGSSPVG